MNTLPLWCIRVDGIKLEMRKNFAKYSLCPASALDVYFALPRLVCVFTRLDTLFSHCMRYRFLMHKRSFANYYVVFFLYGFKRCFAFSMVYGFFSRCCHGVLFVLQNEFIRGLFGRWCEIGGIGVWCRQMNPEQWVCLLDIVGIMES